MGQILMDGGSNSETKFIVLFTNINIMFGMTMEWNDISIFILFLV